MSAWSNTGNAPGWGLRSPTLIPTAARIGKISCNPEGRSLVLFVSPGFELRLADGRRLLRVGHRVVCVSRQAMLGDDHALASVIGLRKPGGAPPCGISTQLRRSPRGSKEHIAESSPGTREVGRSISGWRRPLCSARTVVKPINTFNGVVHSLA